MNTTRFCALCLFLSTACGGSTPATESPTAELVEGGEAAEGDSPTIEQDSLPDEVPTETTETNTVIGEVRAEVLASIPVPSDCREDLPLDMGDMVHNFPVATQEGTSHFLHVETGGQLSPELTAELMTHIKADLRQQGLTLLTDEEVGQSATLASQGGQCLARPMPFSHMVQSRRVALLSVTTREGKLMLGMMAIGNTTPDGPPMKSAELQGELSALATWTDAWSRLVPISEGRLAGMGSLTEAARARSAAEGGTSDQAVLMKVTSEVFGTQPRGALFSGGVASLIGACVSATDFAVVPTQIEVSATGAVTSVSTNSTAAQLTSEQTTCIESALSNALFSCTLSGQAETIEMNLCVR